jgi:hypothetical protein
LKKQWLENLKIAIIEEDFNQIDSLTQDLPALNNIESLKECSALINEARVLIRREQNRTKEEINLIEKNRAFLQTIKNNSFEEIV